MKKYFIFIISIFSLILVLNVLTKTDVEASSTPPSIDESLALNNLSTSEVTNRIDNESQSSKTSETVVQSDAFQKKKKASNGLSNEQDLNSNSVKQSVDVEINKSSLTIDQLQALKDKLPIGTEATVSNGELFIRVPIGVSATVAQEAYDNLDLSVPVKIETVEAESASSIDINPSSRSYKAGINDADYGLENLNTDKDLTITKLADLGKLLNMLKQYQEQGNSLADSNGKPLWTADIAGVNKAVAYPKSGAKVYWTNDVWGNLSIRESASPEGRGSLIFGKSETINMDEYNAGYLLVINQYASRILAYIGQVEAQMQIASNQKNVMESTEYNPTDLKSTSTIWDSGWASLVSIGGLIAQTWGNTNNVTGKNPSVFNYTNSNDALEVVNIRSSDTINSLKVYFNLVIGYIQNGILKQALNDPRSLGNGYGNIEVGGDFAYVPASFEQSLQLNKPLQDVTNLFGLSGSVKSDIANRLYEAIANGITQAVVREFKAGMQISLANLLQKNSVKVPSFTGVAGFSINGTDPTSLTNKGQSTGNITNFIQAAGYVWSEKISPSILNLAVKDTINNAVKSNVVSIINNLENGLTPLEKNILIEPSYPNSNYANYNRNSAGAKEFIIELYSAESQAVQQAREDYLKEPYKTSEAIKSQIPIFVHPGDKTNPKTNYSIVDYETIYRYLQSADVAYFAMIDADNESHRLLNGAVASINKIDRQFTPDNSIISGTNSNVLATNRVITFQEGLKTYLGGSKTQSIYQQAYINVFNKEKENANRSFNIGKLAAEEAYKNSSDGLIPSPTESIYQEYSPKNDDTAKLISLRGGELQTGQAFLDGYTSSTKTLTIQTTAKKDDKNFDLFKASISTKYTLKNQDVSIKAPVIENWKVNSDQEQKTVGKDIKSVIFTYQSEFVATVSGTWHVLDGTAYQGDIGVDLFEVKLSEGSYTLQKSDLDFASGSNIDNLLHGKVGIYQITLSETGVNNIEKAIGAKLTSIQTKAAYIVDPKQIKLSNGEKKYDGLPISYSPKVTIGEADIVLKTDEYTIYPQDINGDTELIDSGKYILQITDKGKKAIEVALPDYDYKSIAWVSGVYEIAPVQIVPMEPKNPSLVSTNFDNHLNQATYQALPLSFDVAPKHFDFGTIKVSPAGNTYYSIDKGIQYVQVTDIRKTSSKIKSSNWKISAKQQSLFTDQNGKKLLGAYITIPDSQVRNSLQKNPMTVINQNDKLILDQEETTFLSSTEQGTSTISWDASKVSLNTIPNTEATGSYKTTIEWNLTAEAPN